MQFVGTEERQPSGQSCCVAWASSDPAGLGQAGEQDGVQKSLILALFPTDNSPAFTVVFESPRTFSFFS